MIVNIYVPNYSKKRVKFFEKMYQLLIEKEDMEVMVMGDFNI